MLVPPRPSAYSRAMYFPIGSASTFTRSPTRLVPNVVRFCEILRVLAEQTQFIVITHNRVTMTHANAIYGISMGGDSVSRVLSMKLEEAAVVAR